MYDSQWREWRPYASPDDPCPPVPVKSYIVPPNQYIYFQPSGLPQFPLDEALFKGTLWPALFSPYTSRCNRKGG